MSQAASSSLYRELGAQHRAEALSKGYAHRHFFPHRFYFLPKCGPDGFRLAQSMCGTTDVGACWEIVLYASADIIAEFPAELFFDNDLVWHEQHFGRCGQVASVDLVIDATDLYALVHLSDVVQRAARRPRHRTRLQNRLKGWHHMLLNAIGNFAVEHGLARVFFPTAAFAMQHTDRKRTVQPALFERIYDRDVQLRFPLLQRDRHWWRVAVKDMSGRVVLAQRGVERITEEKTICICHDVERSLGHGGLDAHAAHEMDRAARDGLDAMLALEREIAAPATYHVVGTLLDEVRSQIEADKHCIAFHSYDHRIDGDGAAPQLQRCRGVDYRVKGYRPPRSILTDELTDANLCRHNFEWLASSARSLSRTAPTMHNRIVRVPIVLDDFALFHGRQTYDEWERGLFRQIATNDFVAFGLHDCYAPHWLPHYRDLLQRLKELGTLRTIDAVAFDVILLSAQ